MFWIAFMIVICLICAVIILSPEGDIETENGKTTSDDTSPLPDDYFIPMSKPPIECDDCFRESYY